MNKKQLLDKVKNLEGLSSEEKAYLLDLVNTKKKYGLVWEDKPEEVEEQLRTHLPVLKEVKERAILNSPPSGEPEGANVTPSAVEVPNHILIEGDNLHALTTLTFTHEGKIDGIYLDPPYNTGAKDWRYNNNYVVAEDSYRHSKWISFMEHRLKLAKNLLTDDGLICVTIDDYEMPRLYILMEEIFGENNHLGTIVIRNNPSGRSTVNGVSITHEYALFFGKSENSKVGRLPRSEAQKNRYKFKDEVGAFEWVNFRKHGGTRKESPSMFYPIYITKTSLRIPNLEWNENEKEWEAIELPEKNENVIYPIDDQGKERRWKWGLDRIKANLKEFSTKKDKNGKLAVYVKARMTNKDVLPSTWWESKAYSATSYGTNLIKDIFGELQIFSYPKSLYAVKDCLRVLSNKKDPILLDAFAGSGTTMHALLELNAEDNGKRTCILSTNNENNICEEVTYERNKRIIQGYTDSKGNKVEGLKNNNLRYYKTDFVERETSLANKRKLTLLATELLCIKEDCYTEVTSKLQESDWHKFFTNGNNNYVYVIYDDMHIGEAVELLAVFIKENKQAQIKVYVFANGSYPYTEEFEEIAKNIELAALPDAIYKAYQNILPKQDKEFVPELEEELPLEFEQ